MRDRARDWSERGRWPLHILHTALPLARSSLSITVDEKRKGLRTVYHPSHDADLSVITFQVPFGLVGVMQYALSVNGSGGLTFQEEKLVMFKEKGLSIYVQTDKGIYKPGQTG